LCDIFVKLIGTFARLLKLEEGMKTTGKIALGVSLASSVVLATWLLTGDRKVKTREFVAKKAEGLRGAARPDRVHTSELDGYYI
jgi:hypothetical protein